MFKFTTQPDPLYYDEDDSSCSNSDCSESDIKYIMVLEYGGAMIRVKCSEMDEDAQQKIENILNGIDCMAGWEDGEGSNPAVELKGKMFIFSMGHSCGYPMGVIELNINYEENKTEINKFLNYLRENYCTDQ